MRVYTSCNECITLSDKAMSSGGQGEIHTVLTKPNRFGNICVKIYFKKERTKFLENKIKYMVANSPNQVSTPDILIGWPLEIVYDSSRNFLGFVMPLAFHGSMPLIALTAKNLSKKLPSVWANKYDRALGAFSMMNRLKLLCNIGIAIHKLHVTGRYVIQDFKPENVLVTPDGKTTLVDMDSIQIAENGRMLYAGTGKTPNYMPPEHYTKGVGTKAGVPLEKSWDYFSVGVVFYQIIFGLHPYVVTPANMGDADSNDIYQNVARNLFPFGSKSLLVKSYPSLHDNFKMTPPALQMLFLKAFADDTSQRPSLETWVKTLKGIISIAPVPDATINIQLSQGINASILPPSPTRSTGSLRGTAETVRSVNSTNNSSTSVNNSAIPPEKSSNNKGCLWCIVSLIILSVIIGIWIYSNRATYLYVSEESKNLYFNADGGYKIIPIATDGKWEISIHPEYWIHATESKHNLSLRIDKNPNESERTDYLTICANGHEVRIDINQSGVGPSAKIDQVWVDHNVYENGYKGMRIHVKFTNKHLKGQKLIVYAYFYEGDNETKLYDEYDDHLYWNKSCTPSYEDSKYDDFKLFVPYSELNMPDGTDSTFSFDISIQDSNGKQLARLNNTRFTYKNI